MIKGVYYNLQQTCWPDFMLRELLGSQTLTVHLREKIKKRKDQSQTMKNKIIYSIILLNCYKIKLHYLNDIQLNKIHNYI